MMFSSHRRAWLGWLGAASAVWIAGCATPPPPPSSSARQPEPELPPQSSLPPPEPEPVLVSQAQTALDYRRDAASHLYQHNAHRIFKGKLPPLLYAVGVLQVQLDRRGRIVHTSWMRAPLHAPEVIQEIERTVQMAAPFPAPSRLGHVTYTETWLWHKSGRFQLHTLSEGQT